MMIGLMNAEPVYSKPSEPWKESKFLQDNVKPILYDLMIKPMFEKCWFKGKNSITCEVTNPTSYFIVHAKNLSHICSSVTTNVNEDLVTLPVKQFFSYPKNDFWILEMEDVMKPGFYNLIFEFEGNLKGGCDGIHTASYISPETNTPRHLVATKFKHIGAREVYPCFDEPQMKAKFKFKIVRPVENYIAITTEMIEKEEFGPEKNEMTVFFKETKPMPPYLSGFIVADVIDSGAMTIDSINSNLTLRLYTVPNNVDKTNFAREIADQVVKFFVNYFELTFPLTKLDLVALPNYPFPSVGQWGLVTFNEFYVLYEDQNCSVEDEKRKALMMSREICRQWFEGLVTVNSLKDSWIIEGFVGLMQFKALEESVKNYKEWKLCEQFVLDLVHPVMDVDSLLETQPLDSFIESPVKVNSFFDDVANKSLAIMNMLEGFAGEENFRRGVNKFLESFKFPSATASDFWDCVNSEINDPHLDVKDVLDTWIKQSGYPVLRAVRRANTWVLSQSRFLIHRDDFCDASKSPYRYKWDVPIHYITSKDQKPALVWFKRSEECVTVTIADRTVSYLKFNHNQTGFYRVNYESYLWQQFAQILKQDRTKFTCLDRANLLDDVFHLAEAGHANLADAIEILNYIENEQDYLPWATASKCIKRLLLVIDNTSFHGGILKLVRKFVCKLYGSAEGLPRGFSWNFSPSDSKLRRMLRIVILDLACISKLPRCLLDLSAEFKEWIRREDMIIQPDVLRILLRYGMRETSSIDDWEVVLARFHRETNLCVRSCLLECLANSKDESVILGILEGSRYRLNENDYFQFFEYLISNPYRRIGVWHYLRNEWDVLVERFPTRLPDLQKLILRFAVFFNKKSHFDEFQLFFDQHPKASTDSDIRKLGTDVIKHNMETCKKFCSIIRL